MTRSLCRLKSAGAAAGVRRSVGWKDMTGRLARVGLLGVLGLLVAALAAAQPADSVLRGFEPTGDWQLSIDGLPAPRARIFEATRAQAMLILASELPSPTLVDRGGRSVALLNMLKVAERMDGTIDLLADAILEPVGGFQIRNLTEAHFSVSGHDLVLARAPWKLGAQTGAALLDSNAGYRWRAKRYEPDGGALGRLRAEKRQVRLLTFFGTWCPHCSVNLPALLKLEQRLADSRFQFDYYGLPGEGLASEPEARKWNVDGVPTAIVLIQGREVGRIPARSMVNPDLALDLILSGAPGGR